MREEPVPAPGGRPRATRPRSARAGAPELSLRDRGVRSFIILCKSDPNSRILGMIKTLLALEEPFIRIGVSTSLQEDEDIDLLGEIEQADGILNAVAVNRPDVLVLDYRFVRGSSLVPDLIERSPDTKILVMVDHTDDQCTLRHMLMGPQEGWPDRDAMQRLRECCLVALKESARGCLPKSASPDQLVAAVKAVAAGEIWTGPAIAEYWRKSLEQPRESGSAGITAREIEVIGLVVDGLSNREIASRLHLGEQTVKNHLARIMGKLHVRNRVELALHAIRERLA